MRRIEKVRCDEKTANDFSLLDCVVEYRLIMTNSIEKSRLIYNRTFGILIEVNYF